MLEFNAIYNQDCREGLWFLPESSISLCITSPPYKDCDGYSEELMRGTFEQVFRVLASNSLFFLNFGHLAEDKFRPFRACQIAMECGFKLNDTITWTKNQYRPLQGNKRLNNLTEFIFLLYKGEMPELNREAIGVSHKDKSNVKRWGRDWKCRGNNWVVGYETIQSSSQKLHNDRFPLEIPTLCIKLANLQPGSVVCDVFSGSGTTCLAAKNLGMRYIGFEINPAHFQTSVERLKC